MSDCSLNIDCITCLADLSSCNACAVNGKYVSCTTGSCETNSTSLNIGTCSALCEMQFDCRACVNAGCQWGTIADLDCDSEEATGPCSQLPVHTNVAKSILAPPVAIDSAKRSANGTNCTEATCSDCTADTSQCYWCYTSMQGHCVSSKYDCNDSLTPGTSCRCAGLFSCSDCIHSSYCHWNSTINTCLDPNDAENTGSPTPMPPFACSSPTAQGGAAPSQNSSPSELVCVLPSRSDDVHRQTWFNYRRRDRRRHCLCWHRRTDRLCRMPQARIGRHRGQCCWCSID
jgi:hypothetical protein